MNYSVLVAEIRNDPLARGYAYGGGIVAVLAIESIMNYPALTTELRTDPLGRSA